MDAILHYYFRIRIDAIRTSQSVSVWEAISANDINKEILEVLNTSFEIKTKSALLKNKKLIDITQSKMETLLQHIITSQKTQGKDEKFDDIMALTIIYFNMGLVYCDTKLQKLDIGKAHFTTCLELLKGKELEPKAIMTVIKVLNELHNISYKCKQPEESCSFLDTATELYLRYTKEEIEYPPPINLNAVLDKLLLSDDEEDPNSKIALENLQLTILLNMSRLYNENPRNKHKFVIYVHNILKQILNKVSIFYIADWVITSAHLSRYFVHNYRFTEAKNHIIIAAEMINKLEGISTKNEKERKLNLYENIYRAYKFGYHSVFKFWGLYRTNLLTASADELLSRKENNKLYDTGHTKLELVKEYEEYLTNFLTFASIEEEKQILQNGEFSNEYVLTLNDAKIIFEDALKCFDTAKSYFTIEKHVVDFITIEIGSSKVYHSLATFYENVNDKLKLYYRARNILHNLIKTLGPVLISCSTLFLFQFDRIILKMMLEVNITLLKISIQPLLLNGEQLNKAFTEEKKNTIKIRVKELRQFIEKFIEKL